MAKHKHPWIRRMLGLGVLAGASYAIWRAIEANRTDRDLQWDPQPFPFPPQPRAAENGWVEPVDGACPASHPVKAKLASGIFHQPGGLSYEATKPDRCYRDAGAAESDGLRPSKR
jgi:hypothetical protein